MMKRTIFITLLCSAFIAPEVFAGLDLSREMVGSGSAQNEIKTITKNVLAILGLVGAAFIAIMIKVNSIKVAQGNHEAKAEFYNLGWAATGLVVGGLILYFVFN